MSSHTIRARLALASVGSGNRIGHYRPRRRLLIVLVGSAVAALVCAGVALITMVVR